MANKEVCPTCESRERSMRECLAEDCGMNQSHVEHDDCPDPWHKVDSLPMPEKRCPRCGYDKRDKPGSFCDYEEFHDGKKVDSLPVEAPPTLTALDDGRYDEPVSREEEATTHVCKPSCHNPCLLDEDERDRWRTKATSKRFTIEVLQEVDGRWLAHIPSVPGAMAYGPYPRPSIKRGIVIAIERALVIREKVLAESRAEKL